MNAMANKDSSWVPLTILAFYFVIAFVFLLEPYFAIISPLVSFLAQLSISTSSDLMTVIFGLICPMILAFGFLAIPFLLTNFTIDQYKKF